MELIVAVGLFSFIMMLTSGAYLIMIGLTERAQDTSTGINNLSFALETMTRTIRTGTGYSSCSGCTIFTVLDSDGHPVSFSFSSGAITKNGIPLTDSSVNVSPNDSKFYVSGAGSGDATQSRVTIIVSGTVNGKIPQTFTVETGATMRLLDL
ncbi:MAG: hypothetical protein WC887_03015 [Candidatus Paceibacterota bacterium]|jgi:Tfp pilus assembly protein PilW